MSDLDNYRDEIDLIDKKIVELYERRMELSLKVAEYKKKSGVNILNREREEQVIRSNMSVIKNPKFKSSVAELFEFLMSQSRQLQKEYIFNTMDKAAFQGVRGSNGEQALLKYFKDTVETVSVKSFEDIFLELKNGNIKYGVLPIENSSTGGISEVYELLNKYGYPIIGEVCIDINHFLMGVKGAKIEDIKEVYSHPQGFAQCTEFLKYHGDWKLIPYENTATSAKLVHDKNDKSIAVIASEKAASIYNLDVIASFINTNKDNITRFAVIGRESIIDSNNNKVSVVLSTEHSSGSLFKVLQRFADNGINLSKIESRPLKGRPWEYLFFIDFEGNLEDRKLITALDEIKNICHYFKILGNYKSFTEGE